MYLLFTYTSMVFAFQKNVIVSGQIGQEVEVALDPVEEGISYMCDII